jgi:hypothetical protein
MVGCFSGNKEGKAHAASQLRFLEEQNLELASALNEWQGLVKQLQHEQGNLKADNANALDTVRQHERTIEQQVCENQCSVYSSAVCLFGAGDRDKPEEELGEACCFCNSVDAE